MKSRIALCAVALGVLPFLGGEALAKKGAKKKQTVQMVRTGDDPDAQGTITVTHGRRGDVKVISLNRLAARATFEVRDADTGAVLGTVKTNRRGHAAFNLTKGVAKSRAKALRAGGEDEVGDPDGVEIVDPTTGDEVLAGDATPPEPVPAEGYADYQGDDGSSADVFMATDPDAGDEQFYLSFVPADDPNADPETGDRFLYAMNLDTDDGAKLPLGVESVTDLAGRAFEIRDESGAVLLGGTLPALEPIDDGWNPGDDTPPSGGCDPFVDPWGGFADPSQFPGGANLPDGNAYFAQKSATKSRKHKKSGGVHPFTLFVADADGVLHDAGDLEQIADDWSGGDDGGWYPDPTNGNDPWSQGGFVVIVIFMPMNGAFDFGSYFQQLMGGWNMSWDEIDGGQNGGSSDPFAGFLPDGGSKHGR